MSGNANSPSDATTETDTTGASGTGGTGGTGGASGGASGITVPNYADLLSKMEYGDNSTDTNKLNAIITATPSLFELPSGAIDERALNCSISAPVNFLYLSTIRGGRKMSEANNTSMSGSDGGSGCSGGCGCGMKGGKYYGGCFTCKKGVKNITLIYSGIHIIIPKLYSKYQSANAIKKAKSAKAAKAAKPKAAKAAKK
uniref:Uncharacterized protein n=1 Tax=viral metagenome TaxID=1070528 RepID=A0A6C0K8Y2_9ZZZZ